ncbi:MAG: alanine--tRNA ligase [Candidatus Levybacteria bacterium]|nr:alanine--tRNA ligase [Candidatus Levybacteria bacterium]
MLSTKQIIDVYISFFEKRKHKQITNSPLVPENDPTTLFTSSGMQPLVPYLLGEPHPSGNRLVDVQNCFRAVDIEEVGDNRHTTFFRMLGNWSLGDYFKSEEIPWLWEFLTKELRLPKEKLYISVFNGYENIGYDTEAEKIWKDVLVKEGLEDRIFADDTNWWSRSGTPDKMPIGEPGGPDTEVYFRFDDIEHTDKCEGDNPVKCECGKFSEIANSVFMQYIKTEDGFKELPNKNVDFGGGVERLLAAVENKSDIFQTSLFKPIIDAIESATSKSYKENQREFRIIADHLRASAYLLDAKVEPSNKERGYILRRLIRRAIDNLGEVNQDQLSSILTAIVEECSKTDESLKANFELIKNSILEEGQKYKKALSEAKKFLEINVKDEIEVGDELKGFKIISAETAFNLYTSYGLSPTQIKSMGYTFNDQEFADSMEKHKELSKTASSGMFKGGLADTSELTIKGHTATHLLHQALRDIFGDKLHQSGSNITSERLRFDFNHDKMLSEGELRKVEEIVRGKIKDNLPVHFEIMPLAKAKELGAIGLFDEKYSDNVKVYFIGDYSREFCGGPHVEFTGAIKSFRIIKQENLGKGYKRIYAKVD